MGAHDKPPQNLSASRLAVPLDTADPGTSASNPRRVSEQGLLGRVASSPRFTTGCFFDRGLDSAAWSRWVHSAERPSSQGGPLSPSPAWVLTP